MPKYLSAAIQRAMNSPEFRRWFEGSRVVDSAGLPQPMFHSSVADIDRFKRRGELGMHFGTPGQAEDRYALKIDRDPYGPELRGVQHNTIPAFLSLRNPLRMNDLGSWDGDNMTYGLADHFPELKRQGLYKMLRSPTDARRFLQGKGYDSVVYSNTGETTAAEPLRKEQQDAWHDFWAEHRPGNAISEELQATPEYQRYNKAYNAYTNYRDQNARDSYIAFDPTQIKSVFNTGSWNPRDPRISYAGGGPVEGGLTSVLRALAERALPASLARRSAALGAEPIEGGGVLANRRLEAARAPFEMAGQRPPRRIETVPNVSSPDLPRGLALDLGALGDWDLAHHEPLERYSPTKVSERVKTAYSPENVKNFEGFVRKGIREGGLNWYDISPLSRAALQEMSPEDFRQLMAMNAASSARSSVADQIKRASLAWYYKKQGLDWPMSNADLARRADPGYGHLAHEIHSEHLAPLVGGEPPSFSPIDQPKYASYLENFMGNLAPLTADTHYQMLHGFPMKEAYNRKLGKWLESPDFSKKVDYPFSEAFSGERARRMGIPTGAYQSAAWVGGKEATGVRDARPFAAVYDELLGRTADQLDISPSDALRKHLRGEIPLMPIGKAEGGMAGGGTTKLLDYIRRRLPRKYADMPMTHLQENPESVDWGGSSRDIYSLGDRNLVKLAKRPRGLYEMSLEGDPRVEQNLPRLRWRSPDNELAVIERMRHTPDQSSSYFLPLQERLEELRGLPKSKRGPLHSLHRTDPYFNSLMDQSGLENFKPFDVHAADFFMTPETHWAMRNPERSGVRPTLLDPGAMDYRVTDPEFEQTHARSFRDVLGNRLDAMLPRRHPQPEELIENAYRQGDLRLLQPYGIARGAEDFIGKRANWPPLTRPEDMGTDEIAQNIRKLMPRQPTRIEDQGTFGFARGGVADRLRSLRQHLAGGGVVRNWLRGVKGSAFDEALEKLKSKFPGAQFQEGMPPMNVENTTRDQALRKWIDTNLANYIVKQHGTEGDPLKEILGHPPAVSKIPAYEMPRVIGHSRADDVMKPGYSAYDAMPKWLQKLYEQDAPRGWSQQQYDKGAGDIDALTRIVRGREGAAEEMKANLDKYQRRNAPPVMLHDLDPATWRNYYEPAMKDTLDYLARTYSPQELSRVSVPDAVRKSKEWHEQMAKQAEKAAMLKLTGDQAYKKYPSGWRWVEMGGADKLEPSERNPNVGVHPDTGLAQSIGKQLGHCYQDPETCADYLSSGKLYSIIDPQGKAHATVEATNSGALSGQKLIDAGRRDLWDKYRGTSHIGSGVAQEGLHAFLQREDPALYERLAERPTINQIRGRQGPSGSLIPINKEALPYVQDFVRSGKWGDVNEYENAGMTLHGGKYMTHPEAETFARYRMTPEGVDPEQWLPFEEAIKQKMSAPRWAGREDEIRRALLARPVGRGKRYELPDEDWTPGSIPGMAKGGQVSPSDFPRESIDERLQRAELALTVLVEEAQQPEYGPAERANIGREIARVEQLIEQLKAAGAGGESGVKGEGFQRLAATSGAPASQASASPEDGGEGDEQETLDMLGQFIGGDPSSEDFLRQLLAEEQFT